MIGISANICTYSTFILLPQGTKKTPNENSIKNPEKHIYLATQEKVQINQSIRVAWYWTGVYSQELADKWNYEERSYRQMI